jgi:hypothetical protein
MQQLPPEVAARQAGRTLATAPAPTTWLLQLLPVQGQAWAEQDTGMNKRNIVVTQAQCTHIDWVVTILRLEL